VALLTLAGMGALVVMVGLEDDTVVFGPPTSSTSAPPAPGVLPLLGIAGDVPQRAALAVKIENTERGRPPTGLVQADVVFEEVVEGGLTRLLAVYQSQDPETVGPVRSARSTDLLILTELGRPLFAWSGANATFAAAVEAADLVDVGFEAADDAYRRDDGRRAPYNLYASPEELRAAASEADADANEAEAEAEANEAEADASEAEADASATPPDPLFEYRAAGMVLAGPGVVTASSFTAGGPSSPEAASLATSIRWDWDPAAGVWVRTQDGTPHIDDAGTPVTAVNVVIRSTPYHDSGVRDSVGAVVPEAAMVGEGEAWLLSSGQAQPGRWHKPSADAPTTYTDLDGAPLLLAPGQTWVEVLPPDAGTIL
jgi:Protein of unknown function (DUF3048) N-terminal domain/Protein of unknown function (DUF3048) C-terminal domain